MAYPASDLSSSELARPRTRPSLFSMQTACSASTFNGAAVVSKAATNKGALDRLLHPGYRSRCVLTDLRSLSPTETSLPRSSLATLLELHVDACCNTLRPVSLSAGARSVSRPAGAFRLSLFLP